MELDSLFICCVLIYFGAWFLSEFQIQQCLCVVCSSPSLNVANYELQLDFQVSFKYNIVCVLCVCVLCQLLLKL